MIVKLIDHPSDTIAILAEEKDVIRDSRGALELLTESQYTLGTKKIILWEKNLAPEFFDLKTGLAGEILQKFSNYDGYLAIIGDFSKYMSQSLRDFIYESNKLRRISFVPNQEEAFIALARWHHQ
jgi:hypothetical protein